MGMPIIPGPNNELITQSYVLPPQYPIMADSSSYAETASYALYAETSSVYIISMSYVQSASYASTSSVAISSSYSLSSSYAVTSSYAVSASYAKTSSYAITSSYSSTASYSVTSSFALEVPKYWGTWYSTQTQTASLINTAYPITVNTAGDIFNGFYISGSDGSTVSGSVIVIPKTAPYDFQFSLQIQNTGGGGSNSSVSIWFRKNGSDIPWSNTNVSVYSNSPYIVAAWDFMSKFNAGDKIELMWSTNHAGNQISAITAAAPAPETPSVIFTIMEL